MPGIRYKFCRGIAEEFTLIYNALMSNLLQGRISPRIILFCLILMLGILARVWGFGSHPPGLNVDEAGVGVDAFSIYHTGVDHNGISYPVHLVASGSGQTALYSYVLIPFIALFGLSTLTVRLPMLIAGILSLPLIYVIAKHIGDEKYALIAMFLLAISPWHIVLSHWGFEGNSLPFIFMIGFACLLKSREGNYWFILACLFFGLSLYAYWTAHAAIIIFMICSVSVLIYAKRVSVRKLLFGLLILFLIGLPIGLFVLINLLHLDTIHLGVVTIPRLPTQPRWETVTILFGGHPLQGLLANSVSLIKLLWVGSDGLTTNTVEPYGYFYPFSLPFALLGAFLLVKYWNVDNKPDRLQLLSWFAAALVIGLIELANINRVNLIFIPLILFVATFLAWLADRSRVGLVVAGAVLLIGFAFFTRDYHSSQYQHLARKTFVSGLVPAVEYASREGIIRSVSPTRS